ncbi:hypothetical protein [Lysobacter gummosus]
MMICQVIWLSCAPAPVPHTSSPRQTARRIQSRIRPGWKDSDLDAI